MESKANLLEQRRQLLARQAYRHRELADAMERERATCRWANPQHADTHIKNIFGPGERMRRRQDEHDARILAHIDQQLAALDELGPEAA
jgi:hypothetical protein